MFDALGYRNSCTLKSCCFAGDSDQYLVSGSDDFNAYVWKILPLSCDTNKTVESKLISNPHLKLRGHRSIVNQCRFNQKFHMLAMAGVEKLIKVWTPYRVPGNTGGGLLGLPNEYVPKRKLYIFNDLFSFRWSTQPSASTDQTIDRPQTAAVSALNQTEDRNDLVIMNQLYVIGLHYPHQNQLKKIEL